MGCKCCKKKAPNDLRESFTSSLTIDDHKHARILGNDRNNNFNDINDDRKIKAKKVRLYENVSKLVVFGWIKKQDFSNKLLMIPHDVMKLIFQFYYVPFTAQWSNEIKYFTVKLSDNNTIARGCGSVRNEDPLPMSGITRYRMEVKVDFPYSHNFYGIYTDGNIKKYAYMAEWKDCYGISSRLNLIANANISHKFIDGKKYKYINKPHFNVNHTYQIQFIFDCSHKKHILFSIFLDGKLIKQQTNKDEYTFKIKYPKGKKVFYPVISQYDTSNVNYCHIFYDPFSC